MSRDRDIVDAIDALVDEQLAGYEQRTGYDHNVGGDKCPHCDADWHGLPITEHMRRMRSNGYLEPGYRYDEDTTRVLCPGSNVHTAARPPAVRAMRYDDGTLYARVHMSAFEPIGRINRPVRFSDPDDDPDDDTSDLTFRELSLQDINRQDLERTRRRRFGRGTLEGHRSHWVNEYGRLTVTGPLGDVIGQIARIDHQQQRYRMQFGMVHFDFQMRMFDDPRTIDEVYHKVIRDLRRARDRFAFNPQVRYRVDENGVTPQVPVEPPHQSYEEFRRERCGDWPPEQPTDSPQGRYRPTYDYRPYFT